MTSLGFSGDTCGTCVARILRNSERRCSWSLGESPRAAWATRPEEYWEHSGVRSLARRERNELFGFSAVAILLRREIIVGQKSPCDIFFIDVMMISFCRGDGGCTANKPALTAGNGQTDSALPLDRTNPTMDVICCQFLFIQSAEKRGKKIKIYIFLPA